MEALIILLVIVILLGALLGGKSLGGTVRKGCGFLLLLIILLIGTIIYKYSESQKVSDADEMVSSGWFIVKYDCPGYTKPDISSDTLTFFKAEEELYIENIEKFKYFYKVPDEYGKSCYVRKQCLIKQ